MRSKNNEKKINWRRWDTPCVKKARGEMGFRNLEAFNMAMLAKQGWQILKELIHWL